MTMHSNDRHDHDLGLSHDLETLSSRAKARRGVLQWVAASSGLFALAACGASTSDSGGSGGTGGTGGSGSSGGTGGSGGSGAGTCSEIPEETAGPYPGDGSNGPNALTLSGIVRSDIRSSVGDADGTAAGVELTVTLRVLDRTDCSPIEGAAVYLWHCDQNGEYSMYDIEDENYLRGVQETDANGEVTFTTIFPGCYAGRWPHMHFEVYGSLEEATTASNKVATSQLALPEDVCNDVYETSGYESSVANLAQSSLSGDNVFGDDDAAQQMATVSASGDGYVASLDVTI